MIIRLRIVLTGSFYSSRPHPAPFAFGNRFGTGPDSIQKSPNVFEAP